MHSKMTCLNSSNVSAHAALAHAKTWRSRALNRVPLIEPWASFGFPTSRRHTKNAPMRAFLRSSRSDDTSGDAGTIQLRPQ
jgi:hypothetical protein